MKYLTIIFFIVSLLWILDTRNINKRDGKTWKTAFISIDEAIVSISTQIPNDSRNVFINCEFEVLEE